MCGRFTQTRIDGHGIAQRFDVESGWESTSPEEATLGRYNVCPTEQIAIVSAKEEEERKLRSARWGLVPGWAKQVGKQREPINARSETVGEKKPFADLYKRADRRCLVVADGWYEWLRSENPKQPRIPFRYTVDDDELFAFAGLFGFAKIGEEFVTSATILTTRANEVCAPVHDRMPVVLAGPDEEAAWLAGSDDPELFAPFAAARTTVRPANPAVNRAGVEGPELIVPPPAEPEAQQTLL
jgi:putative SOS response-associated peptidase YedK